MTGKKIFMLLCLRLMAASLLFSCNDRERQLSEKVSQEVDKRAFSEGEQLPQNVAQPNQPGEGDLNPVATISPSPTPTPVLDAKPN